jgi:transcriptional regulator with XRE-family HTH domain
MLGEKLRAIRKERGLRQIDLALLTGAGKSSIESYEAGRKSPSYKFLEALIKKVGVKPEELFE